MTLSTASYPVMYAPETFQRTFFFLSLCPSFYPTSIFARLFRRPRRFPRPETYTLNLFFSHKMCCPSSCRGHKRSFEHSGTSHQPARVPRCKETVHGSRRARSRRAVPRTHANVPGRRDHPIISQPLERSAQRQQHASSEIHVLSHRDPRTNE
jgi:hypothetical protein